MMKTLRQIVCILLLFASKAHAVEVYQTSAAFVEEAFSGGKPLAKAVWLTGDLKARVASVLGHAYRDLRVRYWALDGRTVWILEEVGKVEPITLGLVVKHGQIEAASGYSSEALLLRQAVETAHGAIQHVAESQPQCQGMGTTVVCCLLHDDRLSIAYVGDSRLYRLREGELDQITRDRLNLELLQIVERQNMTILFVTHSISEAVLLSDRVVVITPRPGCIREIFDIDLPRPRNLELREDAAYRDFVSRGSESLLLGFSDDQ